MKNKGTIFFAIVVFVTCLFAYQEFKKSDARDEEKSSKKKVVTEFESYQVEQVSFKSSTENFTLKKEGPDWKLVEPILDEADSNAISFFVNDIFSQKIEVLEADGPVDLAKYGLKAPEKQFSFIAKGGSPISLAIGGVQTYDKGYYILKNGAQPVLVGDSGWDHLLTKKANDFRLKKLKWSEDDLQGLQVTSSVDKIKSDLQFKREKGDWVSTTNPKIKIKSSAILDYWNGLKHLEAQDIVENSNTAADLKKYKLNQPSLTISVDQVTKEGKPLTNKLNFYFPDQDYAYFFGTQKSGLFKISRSKVNEFLRDLNHFRDKSFPFSYDAMAVHSIELSHENGKTKMAFEKQGEKWTNASNPHENLKQDEVSQIAGGLVRLQAEDFLPLSSKMHPHESQIILKDKDNKIIFDLAYASAPHASSAKSEKKETKVENYIAKSSLSDEEFHISKEAVDSLLNKNFVEEEKKLK
jgi:hypothetical protein